jgi:hypothetical protein
MMFYKHVLLSISLSSVVAADSERRNLRYSIFEQALSKEVGSAFEQASFTEETDNGIYLSNHLITSGNPISIWFQALPSYVVDTSLDLSSHEVSDWTVGIFMRDDSPQNGSDPIVSLTPTIEFHQVDPIDLKGGVTFDIDAISRMKGTDPSWPLSTFDYGTDFDVWLLNKDGAGVVGPEKFSIVSTDEILEVGRDI